MIRPTRRRALAVGLALGTALVTSATVVYAVSTEPDGVHLKSTWANGGQAWLELEDRNVEPAICFLWDNDAPRDGDAIASRILTRAGVEVVDLGTADQWFDGTGKGCEIPRDDRYLDVFARPGDHVVEVRVVDRQGTPGTVTLRTKALVPATE